MYDIRGADGTGTSANPVTSGANVKSYTIRKLADGNCWMTDDLVLPLTVGVGIEASYNNRSTFTYTPTSEATIGTNTRWGTGDYSNVYYYNWYAATAEKGSSSTPANTDVNGSICPKGWKLPSNYSITGSNTTGTPWSAMSYSALTNAYFGFTENGSYGVSVTQQMQNQPISITYNGFYHNGNFSYGGIYTYKWSSSSRYWQGSNLYANMLSAHNSGTYAGVVNPQGTDDQKPYGHNVRCLAVR